MPVLESVTLTLKDLVAEGDRLAQEQDFVNKHKLSEVCADCMTEDSICKVVLGMIATQKNPSNATFLLALRGWLAEK